ncbi:EAL domain-containing protein [Cohnella sp.]|uniref:EAL domain-containing protein n=1 Tax=Cohnella sp. TaxID=1883426 RepID=UPI003568E3A9
MSLKLKIMIYVGLTTFCMLTLLYLISERALLRNYETMELNNSREGMKRVLLAYYDEYRNLGSITINYGGWDDTYHFVERPKIPDPNDLYLTVNYPDSLFESSRLNVTLLMNNQEEIYFGKAYDYVNNRLFPYPQAFIDALVIDHPALLNHQDENSRNEGLIVVDNQPIMLASYPILTSDNKGPVHGTLVFARYLDDNYIQYISEKADMKLSYELASPSFSLPSHSETLIGTGKEALPFWTVTDKTSITSYALLSDYEHKPAMILKFSQSRELFDQAQKNTWFYLIYFTLSGFSFFLLIIYVFRRTIFKRLKRAIVRMSEIESTQGFSLRVQESGKDEITQLEKSFNRMMVSLEHAQSAIQYQADHDVLTGLPNRKAFFKHLEKSIGYHSHFAILFIDLDRFKRINDTWGHEKGDLLLMQIAHRLKQCLKRGDFLCRLGGDEFCLLSEQPAISVQVEQLAIKIKETLGQPYELDGQKVTISVSIGISLYPEHGTEPSQLLKSSDAAMLDVKESGRNNIQWYSESIESLRSRRLLVEHSLQNAAGNGELTLHYQPKWDVKRRCMVGVEALLRWTHPKLGQVSPSEFIPIAESTGLIRDIGEWVIRSACQQVNAWHKQAADLPMIVAVNISGVQLMQPDFVERVHRIFSEEKVDPRCFELEITESTAIEKFEKVVDSLVKLRSMGFMISVDDFGAGYSSMKYLSQLPIQCIKLDKTLIDQLENNERSQVVVSALIEMANRLQIITVAEGVETLEQFRYLRDNSCDQIQGYLLSKPVSAERIPGLVKAEFPVKE